MGGLRDASEKGNAVAFIIIQIIWNNQRGLQHTPKRCVWEEDTNHWNCRGPSIPIWADWLEQKMFPMLHSPEIGSIHSLASLMFYLYKLNLYLAHSSKASSSLHSAMQLSLQGGLCSCRNAPCHCLRSHGYQLTPVPFQTTTAKASTRCADHLGEDLTKIRPRSFPKYHSVWLTVASRTLAGLRFQLIRSIYIK